MNNSTKRISAAIKLKEAKMPVAGVLMFALAIVGDIHDIVFDHTEDQAKTQAEQSNKQAWKASWGAFEAAEKMKLFSQEARLRIQFLEDRATAAERNVESLQDTINQMLMQDRDNRNVTKPQIKRASVPKELKPALEDVYLDVDECSEDDPLCDPGMPVEVSSPVQQQMAPMPSVNEMWNEKKDQKKREFVEAWD